MGEYSVYMGSFDTVVIKVILGSFSAFLFFDKLASRKWLVVERSGLKFGRGEYSVYTGYF